MSKLLKYIKRPQRIILYLMDKNLFDWMPDEPYLKLKYYLCMGKKLNLNEPKTYNEKLQWLKIHDRKKIYTTMVDKYEVKKYVKDIIGEEFIIPTLGIYNSFDEINFDELPDKFVIKCTHDSGGLEIVKDKSKMDKEKVRKKINVFMKRNFFKVHREWPYKNVKPRIIIEQYMEDNRTQELRDYKFYVFNEKVGMMMVATDRVGGNTKMNFYDTEFNLLPFERGRPNTEKKLNKPENLQKMINFAEKLSKGTPHVRVDFYEVDGKLFFGELTFFPASGFSSFNPEEWDRKFGDMLDLSVVDRNEK